jgi:hypothetical protein
MRVKRAGLLVALLFWCGFALLLWGGPQTDVWVRTTEWALVVVLSVAVLWSWRPGRVATLPPTLRRWLTDEAAPENRR